MSALRPIHRVSWGRHGADCSVSNLRAAFRFETVADAGATSSAAARCFAKKTGTHASSSAGDVGECSVPASPTARARAGNGSGYFGSSAGEGCANGPAATVAVAGKGKARHKIRSRGASAGPGFRRISIRPKIRRPCADAGAVGPGLGVGDFPKRRIGASDPRRSYRGIGRIVQGIPVARQACAGASRNR